MDQLVWDCRYAFRQIRRAPYYALAAVVTLALAMGANAAVFSLVNALVFRPLPVRDPGQLALLQATSDNGQNRPIYYSNFVELASLPVFESLALYSGGGVFPIEVRGALDEGTIEASTPGLFETLGLRPHVGRFFTAADSPADAASASVVVLSYDFWRRTFHEDPGAIGETIVIDGTPATVIGVTPPSYKGFYADGGFGFSVPLTFLNRQMSTTPEAPVRGRNAVARLAPGVSLDQARAAVEAAWPGLRVTATPSTLKPAELKDIASQSIRVESLSTRFSSLRQRYEEPLMALWAIVAILLTIGCINLSGLLLARTSARRSQLAICLALGASRAHIVRPLLIESLVLSLAGAALALPMAWWITQGAGVVLWQGSVPLTRPLTPDKTVLGLTAAVAIMTGLVMSALPAWSVSRSRPQSALRPDRTAAASTSLWSRALLVGQVGLSLVLLVGAGLLGSSLSKLRTLDTGIRAEGVRWSRLFAVPGGYRNQNDAVYYPELVRQLTETPGIQSVALGSFFPTALGYDDLITPQSITRADVANGAEAASAIVENVTPRFFETVGVPVLAGRDFNWNDRDDTPEVVILNETLSRGLFPEGNPIGRRVRIGQDPAAELAEVVGIVGNASYKRPQAAVAFRPRMQELGRARAPVLLFRSNENPSAADKVVTKVIDDMGKEYPRRFFSVSEHVERVLLQERLLAILSSFFAGLAVLLSIVGLYSQIAYTVARRTREIAIRLMLGATPRSMTRMVIREGLSITLLGVAVGIPCALAAGRLIRSFLFGLHPADPTTLFGASALFVVIGVAAALRPARLASTVDPLAALRAE